MKLSELSGANAEASHGEQHTNGVDDIQHANSTQHGLMTSTQATKVGYLTVSANTDLDTIRSRVSELDAAIVLQGQWDPTTGIFPGAAAAQKGQSWIASAGGTVDGIKFVANDRILALVDSASETVYTNNWLKLDYSDLVSSIAGETGSISKADLLTALNVEDGADVTDVDNVSTILSNQTVDNALQNTDEVPYLRAGTLKKVTWDNIQSTFILASTKGSASGVAELNTEGLVISSQLPSYVDDVLEYPSLSDFPSTGETGKIYIAQDTNKTYRWSGSGYSLISESLAIGETSSTAYRGDRGKTAYDHSQTTGTNPHNVPHSEIKNINSDDHHSRYTDSEAASAAKSNATGFGQLNFDQEYNNGTKSVNTGIDFSNGINQVITLAGDITLSFNNMGVGTKKIRIVQDGTGGRVPTLPNGKWPGGEVGEFSSDPNAEDILCIYYNGSSYYYQLTKGWA